jgi:hypothetical protein
MAQAIEPQPSKRKALSENHSTTQKKKRRGGGEKSKHISTGRSAEELCTQRPRCRKSGMCVPEEGRRMCMGCMAADEKRDKNND